MINIGSLAIRNDENTLVFSVQTDTKKFAKLLTIIYLILFGFIDFSLILPSYFKGEASLGDVLIANTIFFVICGLFILLSPMLMKFMGKNLYKTTDFITLDKKKGTLYFRTEDVSFDVKTIKNIKVEESKNSLGVAYYISVVTLDLEKRMMPQLIFKYAKQIVDTLKQELNL
jgi:hypothetical protein